MLGDGKDATTPELADESSVETRSEAGMSRSDGAQSLGVSFAQEPTSENGGGCLTRWRPWSRFADEAKGFVYLYAARGGPSVYAALFANVALNEFAYSVADCDGTVLNGSIQASSVVSSIGVVAGILTAVLSPIVGTISDLTPRRKGIMGASYIVLIISILVQVILFISKDSDKVDPDDSDSMLPRPVAQSSAALVVLCAAIVIKTLSYEAAALLTSTFAPELATDDKEVARYVGYAYLLMNWSQLFCAIVIIAVAMGAGFDSFQQAVAGGVFVLIYCIIYFVPGYRLMEARTRIDPTFKRSCCGLLHLGETLLEALVCYPDLIKFFVSWSFANAASTAVSVLATSYLQNYLGFDGTTTSALLAVALLFSVPGSLIVPRLSRSYSLKTIYVLVNAFYGLTFTLAPVVFLSDEVLVNDANATTVTTNYGFCDEFAVEASNETQFEARGYVFYLVICFCIVWGVLLGGIYTASTSLFSALVPGGKEATYFSLKVTLANVLTWLPSLAYTAINEAGATRWAIISLGPIFLVAAVIAAFINLEKAKMDIGSTLHRRQGKVWAEHKSDENEKTATSC